MVIFQLPLQKNYYNLLLLLLPNLFCTTNIIFHEPLSMTFHTVNEMNFEGWKIK